MIRRTGLVVLAVISLLFLLFPLVACAQQPAKPILLIIHSDECPPCRVFDRVYTIDADLRTALNRAFDVRELDMGIPSQRLEAARYGVTDVPTYLVLRNGKPVSTHRGFSPTMEVTAVNRAIADLLDDLQVEWPLAKVDPPRKSPPASPRLEPKPIASQSHPGPTIDQVARDGITKLAAQSRELQESTAKTQSRVEAIAADVQKIRSEVTESANGLRSQIESGSRESRTQLETISRTMRESLKSIESERVSTREELQTLIRNRIDATQALDQRPDISTEIPTTESAPGATASKWLHVLAWAGKTGLAIAAPEVAIPGSIGLTVAGLGLRWLMKRRKPKPLGTVENPIRVADNGDVRTETKFVVSETDVLGESFKEAIRRVGNAHRESSPHIVDVLKQVDAAATQLAHGKRVTRRPAMAPVSESDP